MSKYFFNNRRTDSSRERYEIRIVGATDPARNFFNCIRVDNGCRITAHRTDIECEHGEPTPVCPAVRIRTDARGSQAILCLGARQFSVGEIGSEAMAHATATDLRKSLREVGLNVE